MADHKKKVIAMIDSVIDAMNKTVLELQPTTYVGKVEQIMPFTPLNMLTQLGPEHPITKAALAMYAEFPETRPAALNKRKFLTDYDEDISDQPPEKVSFVVPNIGKWYK